MVAMRSAGRELRTSITQRLRNSLSQVPVPLAVLPEDVQRRDLTLKQVMASKNRRAAASLYQWYLDRRGGCPPR
jgi:hypothetical protein